jgi:hypothetical protein
MADQITEPARYVRLRHGTVRVGQLAGRAVRHPHAPDSNTGSLCLACYGWADDARHLTTAPQPTTGIGGLPAGRHA